MIGSQAINRFLKAQMDSDATLHLLGESLEINPESSGLMALFPERVHQLPAADQALIGLAVGLAMTGKRVLLFACGPDSIWGMMQQIRQEIDPCGSEFPLNITVKIPFTPNERVPVEELASLSNIKVMTPSRTEDAQACLQTALTGSGTTIILEDRRLLMADTEEISSDTLLDSPIRKTGDHVSVISWGTAIEWVTDLAYEYEQQGISIEAIGLKSISLINSDVLVASVKKTGRAIFINTPSQATKAVVNGAFWRLEAPLQHISANRDELNAAIEEALRY